MIRIRPFHFDRDSEAYCATINEARPYWPFTIEEFRHNDATRDHSLPFARFVAERDGAIVGVAMYRVAPTVAVPNRFEVSIDVRPARQREGIGTALWEHVLAETLAQGATSWVAVLREDDSDAARFLTNRRFVELDRGFDSSLDLVSFDWSRWEGSIERACRAAGVEIRSLAELMPGVPDWQRRCYELDQATIADAPNPEPTVPLSFELYRDRYFEGPNFMPQGTFFAVTPNAEWVGLTIMRPMRGTEDALYTGMTGVLRPWRRRGIALALKLHALRWANSLPGIVRVTTSNAASNRPMLSINEALGFVKEPAIVAMKRTHASA